MNSFRYNDPVFLVLNGFRMAVHASLIVEIERLDVTTQYKMSPDMKWTFTDARKHYHAFSEGEEDRFPTLDTGSEHVPCSDPENCGCEGYSQAIYNCKLCGEKIEPRWITTENQWREYAPGRKSWRFEIDCPTALGCEHLIKWHGSLVTAVLETPEKHFFGIGFVNPSEIATGDFETRTWSGIIAGHGPLGSRDA